MSPLRSLIITALLFCCSSNPLLAQKESKAQSKKSGFKVNPIYMFGGTIWSHGKPLTGNLGASLEIPVFPFMSLETEGAYLYESPIVDWNKRVPPRYRSMKVKGYYVHAQWKYFFLSSAIRQKAPFGPYFGIAYSLARANVKGVYDDGKDRTKYSTAIEKQAVGVFSTGYQAVIKNNLTVDFYLEMNYQTLNETTVENYSAYHDYFKNYFDYSHVNPTFWPRIEVKIGFFL